MTEKFNPYGKLPRRGALALGIATGLALMGGTSAQARPGRSTRGRGMHLLTTPDWATPARFDLHNSSVNGGNGQRTATNEAGALAWQEAGIMRSYVTMYLATANTTYLDFLVTHADSVLASRDSIRGVTNYQGLSLPAWRTGHTYTCPTAILHDTAGVPVLRVVSAATSAGGCSVTVAADPAPGRFTLTVANTKLPTRGPDVYADLSMDPTDARYAPTLVTGSYQAVNVPTASLLVTARAAGPGGVRPAPAAGTFAMPSGLYNLGVDTGEILAGPMAFVRAVHENPVLATNPTYASRAATYLDAVLDAVAVYDADYREDASGRGWYVSPRGCPMGVDGADLPHNQSLSLGSLYIDLYAVTGDPAHRSRAVALARSLRQDLVLMPNNAYVWHYNRTGGPSYSGWEPGDDVSDNRPYYPGFPRPEDIAHAAIEINFVAKFISDQLDVQVFGMFDVARFAATFSQHLLVAAPDPQAPTIRRFVEGPGPSNPTDPTYELSAPSWLPLGDATMFDHCVAIYDKRQPAPSASTIRAISEMVLTASLTP